MIVLYERTSPRCHFNLLSPMNRLTFLHLANAIIVIRFPGTPTNMNTMQVADAKCSKPDGYPWNSSSDGNNGDDDDEKSAREN